MYHSIPIQNPNTILATSNAIPTFNGTKKIVFGWHPYWREEYYREYNYKLLSHIAFFSCGVDCATGKLQNKERWENSPIIGYSKTQNPNCKVLLTVSCFGQKEISIFLRDNKIQDILIQDVYNTLIKKNADGVCLEFYDLNSINRRSFELFVSKLNAQLKKDNLLLFLCLPGAHREDVELNFSFLNSNVDQYIVEAYDYFGGFSKDFDGPIAPLKYSKKKPEWIHDCVFNSIDYYLNQKIPPNQLVLGIPYYGCIWEVDRFEVPGKPTKFIGYRTYNDVLKFDAPQNKFISEEQTGSSYYSYKIGSNSFRHYWMETPYTIGLKYDFAMQNNLAGVAIFALSFDYGTNDLWKIIKSKFFTDSILISTQLGK